MINPNKVDILNFALIWISLLAAFSFPYELFLFSYAVIGPLHYMTEINWLEKKNYFLKDGKEKRDYLLVIVIVIIFLSSAFFISEASKWDATKGWYQEAMQGPLSKPLDLLKKWGYSSIFVVLFLAVIFNVTENRKSRILLLCLSILLTMFFFRYPFFATWFGIFLPTLVHVFLFTFLFMWSGTAKSKSSWGYLNLISLAAVVLIIFKAPVAPTTGSVSQETVDTYIASNFLMVNYEIGTLLGFLKNNSLDIYSSSVWKTQVFIAFAYTYHYLNWFSKTSVINWHRIDSRKMKIAIVLWLAAVTLYYINYHLGFVALFVLSMLHVILEFPLNISSIKSLATSDIKPKTVKAVARK